tara:strand:- start:548 stop:1126 length:579 start_codon:yes stop_codon:yes gene_type:complete
MLCQPVNKNSLDPVIKSFLVPGWGQNELGYKSRSKKYIYVEVGILLSLYTSSKYSNEIKRNYIAYAAKHAGIVTTGKDREYWVDIGNFNTLNDYNSEHLRNREVGELYPQTQKWNWNWDTSKNRKYFESRRIQSDKMKLFSTFTIGGLFLNHFVSSIDALYLKRLSTSKSFSIKPYIVNKDMLVGYKFELKL